jgi:hypothetical protein
MIMKIANYPPTQIERERWKELRKRGKLHFVFVRGVVGWGSPMFIFFTFFSLFASSYWHTAAHINLHFLAVQAVVYILGGAFWGLWTWRPLERRFTPRMSRSIL